MKLALALVLALSSIAALASRETERAMITATVDAIKVLSKADRSCQTAADCTSIAVGKRSCGGPSLFMSVSKNNSELDMMEALAKRSTELESAFNLRYNVISICTITMPSPADCRMNKCM